MTRIIDEVYESIAQNIVNVISDDWSNATLKVEFYINAMELKATYLTLSGKTKDLDTIPQMFKDFKDLYFIMTKEGELHKWNRATFKLAPTGKFSIDFDWDQELADEIERLK
ncbi:MAG: DUF600 family protein [Methyloprofundus sp.]|nr:DUF600 family protein [Methyloprofundus sp.]